MIFPICGDKTQHCSCGLFEKHNNNHVCEECGTEWD